MDDRRPVSPGEQIGSDPVPTATDLRHPAELDAMRALPGGEPIERLPNALRRDSSKVVYSGTDQRVSEGFAIALRIMGIDANFLPAGTALVMDSPNTEDT